MADKITEIEKWKIIYPFLKDLRNEYDKFDNPVQDNANKNNYETVCRIFLKPFSNDKIEHYNFCMKLLRNLGVFLEENYSLDFTHDRCNYLNYWIYSSIKKHNIQDNLINHCFDDYSELTRRSTGIRECKYHSYEENYDNPMIAIMLNIFVSKISDIREALIDNVESTYIPSHKFVCECFNIYKSRYKSQCPNKYTIRGKQKNTCDKLDAFKIAYEGFLLHDGSLDNKIPLFDNMEREYETKCKIHEKIQALVPRVAEGTDDTLSTAHLGQRRNGGPPFSAGEDEYAQRKFSLDPNGEETTGSPISSTISTAVGTVAGASSVLALLYKFTPGRKWIHSGFGGRRARIGSNLYGEGASELLYNGLESEDFSSYNQRYDIGYSPV
ncbi:unnamed protein product [Plasmodium vivax]|uniref:(malaria parasite P. vivax) hypothetical protein n=1 Tax=Plasmodium vivax TaxID=5855 RepID=A0A8S4H989_PLAVI|nr:unnamed protein product [Plasmodium vivax]